MDKQADRQTDGRTSDRAIGQTDERTNRRSEKWTNGQTDKLTTGQALCGTNGQTNKLIDGLTGEHPNSTRPINSTHKTLSIN